MARIPTLGSGDKILEKFMPSRVASQWQPTTTYAAGAAILLPDGTTGTRTANGTSRASFDATEKALWTVAASGGLSQSSAKALFTQRAVATSPQVGALVRKMTAGADNAAVTVLGDSTSAATLGWFNLLMARLGVLFPKYTVVRRDFDHTNQRYNPVSTVVQLGTAGARRMVATGASTDKYFTVADSAATSPTGDLTADFEVMIPALGGAFTLGGKYDTATNNRGWFVSVDAAGKISLFFSTDGLGTTQLTRVSSVSIPAPAVGVRVWIRVQFDVDNGASGNDFKCFYSLDDVTYTQIGTTITNAGVQSIFDAATDTQLNSRGGNGNSTGGAIEYYGMRVWSSLATATARPGIDFRTAQWNGFGSLGTSAASFLDFVGNTVQVRGTGNTGSMVGAPVLYVMNGAVAGQAIAYANDATRFPILTPLVSDLAFINYSHNEIGLIDYRPPYKQLADALVAKWPDAGIVATIQNQKKSPASNIIEHAIRGGKISALAGSQRWAVVDIAGTFAATANPDALVQSDGIHPTDEGYSLAAAEAELVFTNWLKAAA
ncbi:SGNH/GDSL hydrolase family protein [Rhodococcus sp. NPDC079359]|uniref:SGNH/GDSL hydrolase family protein n=1 Tax=Rhodococcus sp. NPDC079359 TaxID=3154961 RepID=UPI0034500369